MRLKRRMLATIRFIGELCKEGLLKTSIMHECILNLIAITDENGELVRWKEVQDEQCIELLCRLLHTIGGKLEETASEQQLVKIDWYFKRLEQLSKVNRQQTTDCPSPAVPRIVSSMHYIFLFFLDTTPCLSIPHPIHIISTHPINLPATLIL